MQEQWHRHVILRSSIIYGPQSPTPVSRALFLQFVAQQLAEDKPTSFFVDEYRNPVYVHDIVSIVLKLLEEDSQSHMTARYLCSPLGKNNFGLPGAFDPHWNRTVK